MGLRENAICTLHWGEHMINNENAVGGGSCPCVRDGSNPPHLHRELTHLSAGCQHESGTVRPKQLQVFLIPQNRTLATSLKLIYKLTSLWVLLRTVKKKIIRLTDMV